MPELCRDLRAPAPLKIFHIRILSKNDESMIISGVCGVIVPGGDILYSRPPNWAAGNVGSPLVFNA
jgi:hypothetical protein